MTNKNRLPSGLLVIILSFCLTSCEKFLDTKPDQKLTVPHSLDDLQALMDDFGMLITESIAGEISADDYFVSDADLSSLSSDFHRRMYLWESSNLFQEGIAAGDWGRCYTIIYYCNTVLETLDKIERTVANQVQYDLLKGRALFLRAQKLFNASLIWCNVYDRRNADQELGMPLRLDTDFNKVSSRSTLEETYQRVISDAKEAIDLLPENVLHTIEPSRSANYSLLARVYLYMGDYDKSYYYADLALSIKSDLMDYSTLNAAAGYPIPQFNSETILYIQMPSQQILNLERARITTDITKSYAEGDLRRAIYFIENPDGTYGFRGRYTGSVSLFMGYATDELYLIRAESAVRMGRKADAIADLNTLLSTRWAKVDGVSTYPPIGKEDSTELLNVILSERRKSLIFRGLRWYDLKRLNRDGADIILKRRFVGKDYVLLPNDLRYALPIPEDVVQLSNIIQNPR